VFGARKDSSENTADHWMMFRWNGVMDLMRASRWKKFWQVCTYESDDSIFSEN